MPRAIVPTSRLVSLADVVEVVHRVGRRRAPEWLPGLLPKAFEPTRLHTDRPKRHLTLGQISEVLELRDDGQAPCRHVEEVVAHRLVHLDPRSPTPQELRTPLCMK